MEFSFSEEQKALRKKIINFSQQELNDRMIQRDKEGTFDRTLWDKCAEQYLLGIPIPREYGGLGVDPLSCAIAFEALGYGCHDSGLVFSIGAQTMACAVPLWKFGSDIQKKTYLPGMCNGSTIALFALTEPLSGSDVASISTTAIPDGKGYRLNGKKVLITNAPVADLAIVIAVTDEQIKSHGGLSAFLINQDSPGIKFGSKVDMLGHRTTPVGEVILENVLVSKDDVLGQIGMGMAVFSLAMNWERICLFAGHIGIMERLLEKSVSYARKRKQGNSSIGKFQAVSHKLADMKVQLEAARLLIYKAAWQLDKSKEVSLDAAMAKLFVSETFLKSALETVQIFGGNGYLTENEVERSLRDAVGTTLYSGTSEIQRNIIAKWLGL